MIARPSAAIVIALTLALGSGCGQGHGALVSSDLECQSAPFTSRATSGDLERDPLEGPATTAIHDGAVRDDLVLDNALRLEPPREDDRAAYAGSSALCMVLASSMVQGGNVGQQSADTIAFGLGRVTVPAELLSGHEPQGDAVAYSGSTDGVSTVFAKTPPPEPYEGRLAWIGIVSDISNCHFNRISGSDPITDPTPPTQSHNYGVFIVDAATGSDLVRYSEPGPCGGSDTSPSFGVPITQMSVPWTLVSEEPDRSSAQIAFQVGPCDGYEGVVLADQDNPALVGVYVQRPSTSSCAPNHRIVEKMRAAVVGAKLPAHLEHAPVGPYVG
ncbi:MAG: hypothetical protein QOG53_667 [Frankiales bacterium]|nr:hypothetical protein [Frankiales bacterium]